MSFRTHQIKSTTRMNPLNTAAHLATRRTSSNESICEVDVHIPAEVAPHHDLVAGPGQCCSVVQQLVAAPLPDVWSVVSRFDRPQAYKQFVRSCRLVHGDGRSVGTVREVQVQSGLPAVTSLERLEILDEERHVMSFSIVGGQHRLTNYRSVTTLHRSEDDPGVTVVVESYIVDVPLGNTTDDTLVFVNTIVGCNLRSLADTAETAARTRHQLQQTRK